MNPREELLELDELELEEEFRLKDLPGNVQTTFQQGAILWPLAVQRAIAAGITSLEDLTDMVFFMHHPERLQGGIGMPLSQTDPQFSKLAAEWKGWRAMVEPMLRPATPPAGGAPTPKAPLRYGVPGGSIGPGKFDQWRSSQRYTGYHLAIDVTSYRGAPRGADDPRRGLPVYFTPKLSFTTDELEAIRKAPGKDGPITPGLGLGSRRGALLETAHVIRRWQTLEKKNAYGSGAGIAAVYRYPTRDGATGHFTLYIEYLHLITRETLPVIRTDGTTLSLAEWAAAGKMGRLGFGARMVTGTVFLPADLTAQPPLVGYLGTTVSPHVHIQVAFSVGAVKKYIRYPRVDPAAVLR